MTDRYIIRTTGQTGATGATGAAGSPLRGWFDIRDYGAAVDGSTNDDTAITAAETAAAAVGGVVYFPAGTTITSGSRTGASGVTYRGAGPFASIIKLASGVSNGTKMWSLTSLTNVRFENLRFSAPTGKTGLQAVVFQGCTGCVVDTCSSVADLWQIPFLIHRTGSTPSLRCGFVNVDMEGATDSEGMEILDSNYCFIERCRVRNLSGSGSTGIVTKQTTSGSGMLLGTRIANNEVTDCVNGIAVYGDTRSVVTGNVITNCQATGFRAGDGDLGSSGPSKYGTFTGNVIRNAAISVAGACGIAVVGSVGASIGWVVADNTVDTTGVADGYGISIQAEQTTVTGNHVNLAAGWGMGINSNYCTIAGNTVLNPCTVATANTRPGLLVSKDNNVIVGNTFSDDRGGSSRMSFGIQLASTADNNSIIGNRGTALLSAFYYDGGGSGNFALGNTGTPAAVTGVRSGNAALTDLLSDLATAGIITNSTTAEPAATGVYVTAPAQGTSTTLAMALNMAYFIPYDFGAGRTISKMGVEVTTGVATSVMRLGIASMGSNGKPSALLLDAGTVSAASTGEFEITGLSTVIPGGWGYIIVACQVAGSSALRGVTSSPNRFVSNTTVTQAVRTNTAGYTQTSVSGALPSTFTVDGSAGQVPAVALYFSA